MELSTRLNLWAAWIMKESWRLYPNISHLNLQVVFNFPQKLLFALSPFSRKEDKGYAAPGKTTHINYFSVDQKLYLVDLPGYGYAKVSKQE